MKARGWGASARDCRLDQIDHLFTPFTNQFDWHTGFRFVVVESGKGAMREIY